MQAASFIETMGCLAVSELPDGMEWTHEIPRTYDETFWPSPLR